LDITQSWVETTPSLLGAVSTVHDSQEEFYDGEFSGSVILVTTQSLNQPFPQNYIPFSYKHVYYFSTGMLRTEYIHINLFKFKNISSTWRNTISLYYPWV
jgi:hypothetical protein